MLPGATNSDEATKRGEVRSNLEEIEKLFRVEGKLSKNIDSL